MAVIVMVKSVAIYVGDEFRIVHVPSLCVSGRVMSGLAQHTRRVGAVHIPACEGVKPQHHTAPHRTARSTKSTLVYASRSREQRNERHYTLILNSMVMHLTY
ncbi:unnamed protein product [Spodoptera exigua]|nr:unnamed protein product [Spodoptera exigua]